MIVTETQLDKLRLLIKDVASARRYGHILGVERMAACLASIYCPEKEGMLRAAALLHDVTKEKSFEEQLAIFEKYRVNATEEQLSVPPTIHAVTAPLIIPDEYPEYSDAELLNAIRYHSTGRENMTLSEKIIFLSDYIEDTRTFEDCIALREEFFSAFPEKMSEKERINHLNRVLLHSMELTIEELRDSGKIIESATLHARDSLRRELAED